MPQILNFPNFIDERGNLTVYDPGNSDLPFIPKRVFWIWGVPEGQERANHAHEMCEQIIIPLAGGFVIEIDDNDRYYLKAHAGLYVEAGHKIRLYSFSKGAICLVLCSEYYDEGEVVG
jgi:hypothetical protein